jgi:flavodoxin
MAYIKIVYGTCGGNTEITSEKVKILLEEYGHKVDLFRAKTAKPTDLLGADLLILASPTYGHGLLENYMDKFVASCNKSINQELSGQLTAVIGLGNSTYDHDYFLESAKILSEFLIYKGSDLILEPLLISKSPIPFFKKVVPEWVKKINDKLSNND